jgi:hypothetical protein
MPADEESAPDLDELLADVLTSGTPETELLLAYIRDPEMMDPDDRSRVEAYLSASPAHRDRLKVLKNLAFLDDLRAAMPPPPSQPAEASYAALTLSNDSAGSAATQDLAQVEGEDRSGPLQGSHPGLERSWPYWVTGVVALAVGIALGIWLA